RNLGLLAAVGVHSPDLHVTRSHGIEVDVFAIWRVLGAVIEAFGSRESLLFASLRGNRVDVEVPIALADNSERFSIWLPAMPIGRGVLCNWPRCAAGEGKNINLRFVIALRIVTDDELLAVGRDAVVVVAAAGNASVDDLRRTTGGGH